MRDRHMLSVSVFLCYRNSLQRKGEPMSEEKKELNAGDEKIEDLGQVVLCPDLSI